MSLLLATVVLGGIFALAQNLESELARKPPAPPLSQTLQGDPGASDWLWPRLQQGIPGSDFFLEHVEVYSASGNLPPEVYTALDSTPCSGVRKAPGAALLIEAQVRILTPSVLKAVLYANLENVASAVTPPEKRPAFFLFNLITREDFALFVLDRTESSAFCLAMSNGKTENRFVMTGESDAVLGSVSGVSLLALGELGTYSDILKLPIWSHRE
jgi:hypothetical protein